MQIKTAQIPPGWQAHAEDQPVRPSMPKTIGMGRKVQIRLDVKYGPTRFHPRGHCGWSDRDASVQRTPGHRSLASLRSYQTSPYSDQLRQSPYLKYTLHVYRHTSPQDYPLLINLLK